MKHWTEFQPRSLCSFDGGPDGGDGDGGGGPPSGDFSGDFTGGFDPGGDPTGSTLSNDAFFGDSAPAAPTGGDSWTGSETSGTQFASSDPGSFFGSDTSGGPSGSSFYSGGGSEGGFIGPNSDFGYSPGDGWGPTGGVDYAGTGGFVGPASAGLGFGNAIGPAGWATGDFGMQGYGGPTGTGAGPGSTASIGGPQAYAQAPGINGFPGDFGAPPGGAFGMPNQGDVGPQVGPGLLGGPTTVQQGEALNPSLFGPEVTSPDVTRPSDDRTEVDPTTVFGPAVTANAGWFGPSQAQAADRGTDQDIINAANFQAMFANDFGRTNADLTAQYMANTNPGLAQALSQAAAAYQGEWGQANTGQLGPGISPFGDTTPGAQQGFQGGSGPFGGTQGQFSGQPTLSGVPGFQNANAPEGKGDLFGPPSQQANPNMDQIGPMVTQQGYQQLAAELNAQRAAEGPQQDTFASRFDALGPQQTSQQPQTGQIQNDNFASRFDAVTTPQQTIQNAFDDLAGKPAQSDTFDSRFGQMQAPAYDPNAAPPAPAQPTDTFDSRFGDWGPPAAPPGRGAETETIGLPRGDDGRVIADVISNLNPATLGAGGGIGVPGLLSMYGDRGDTAPAGRPGGSPTGNPSQAGSGPFGPSTGRGSDTSGRPGVSITVGGNQQAGGRPGGPGYYQSGGAGIAPGAKGAEYGGAYGINSPGRPGTSAFGGDFRQGGGGGAYFYDPATGQYYQAGARR